MSNMKITYQVRQFLVADNVQGFAKIDVCYGNLVPILEGKYNVQSLTQANW